MCGFFDREPIHDDANQMAQEEVIRTRSVWRGGNEGPNTKTDNRDSNLNITSADDLYDRLEEVERLLEEGKVGEALRKLEGILDWAKEAYNKGSRYFSKNFLFNLTKTLEVSIKEYLPNSKHDVSIMAYQVGELRGAVRNYRVNVLPSILAMSEDRLGELFVSGVGELGLVFEYGIDPHVLRGTGGVMWNFNEIMTLLTHLYNVTNNPEVKARIGATLNYLKGKGVLDKEAYAQLKDLKEYLAPYYDKDVQYKRLWDRWFETRDRTEFIKVKIKTKDEEIVMNLTALKDLYEHLEYFRKLIYELSKPRIPNPLIMDMNAIIDNIESQVEREKKQSIREHMPPTMLPRVLSDKPLNLEEIDPKYGKFILGRHISSRSPLGIVLDEYAKLNGYESMGDMWDNLPDTKFMDLYQDIKDKKVNSSLYKEVFVIEELIKKEMDPLDTVDPTKEIRIAFRDQLPPNPNLASFFILKLKAEKGPHPMDRARAILVEERLLSGEPPKEEYQSKVTPHNIEDIAKEVAHRDYEHYLEHYEKLKPVYEKTLGRKLTPEIYFGMLLQHVSERNIKKL